MSELSENVKRCSCGSPLFLNWGLEVIAGFDYRPPAGVTPHGKDWTSSWQVHVCAMCDKPWGVWDGMLHDASEIISAEDVQAVILRLHRAPAPAQAKAMDP